MSHTTNVNFQNQPEAALDKVSVTNSFKKWSEDQQKLIISLNSKISELECALLPTTSSNPFADFEAPANSQSVNHTSGIENTGQAAVLAFDNSYASTATFTVDTFLANSHDLIDLLDISAAPASLPQVHTLHTPLTYFSNIPIPNEHEASFLCSLLICNMDADCNLNYANDLSSNSYMCGLLFHTLDNA